jgi:anti-anti-sigma factor
VRAQSIEIQFLAPSTCVVRMYGEHDVSSREAVAAALVAAQGQRHVLVDLARCSFIDSSLISTLLAAANEAQQRGDAVELIVPVEANAVRRTLELANIQRVLPFHASSAAALKTIAARELLDDPGAIFSAGWAPGSTR